MKDTFNANFYIVTATINPIFFLALTLQGTFYGGIIGRINDTVRGTIKAREAGRGVSGKEAGGAYIALGLTQVAMATLVAGVGGEITALAVLYHQQAGSSTQAFVFWSTVGMISLTAVTPGWAVLRAFYDFQIATIRTLLFSVKDLRNALKELRIKHEEPGSEPAGQQPTVDEG